MSSNTNPARGMRDFLPVDIRKRNYVIGIIRKVYEKYGFEPLETPSIENLSTLTNKYGEEGDQLMFKILKRGEKLAKKLEKGGIKNENELTDLALRYDLTVPLARVVATYKNDLPKFFKRYQIQPVWRADRPARGRYREFYQCDVDAIGSSSMIVEAELCAAVSEILERLGFDDFEIKLNHRQVLQSILDKKIPAQKQKEAITIIDKLDKIKVEGVLSNLTKIGINEESVKSLGDVFTLLEKLYKEGQEGYLSRKEKLEHWNSAIVELVSKQVESHEKGKVGLQRIRQVREYAFELSVNDRIRFDVSLARGLSYYTGAIFEVVLTNGDFSGSIAGGGRYDGLIGMFGKEEIPAVGFSLGLERILLIMEERGMFPDDLTTNAADVLVTVWNEETAGESLKLASELRQKDLRVLVYPQPDKLGKQFKYADQIDVKYVCVLGETELAENKVTLKNMKTGEQETVSVAEATRKIKL
ncbi:MAG: histidine--tRNA ligase [Aridibacter sp.]